MIKKKRNVEKKLHLNILAIIFSLLFICLIVILNNKQTTISKAQSGNVGSCKDNPELPPQGYTWVADCNKHCTSNAECPKNYELSDPEWKSKSNWCYGFKGNTGTSDDFRCLMLVFSEVSSNMPITTPFANGTVSSNTSIPSTDVFVPSSSTQATGGFFGGGSVAASMDTLNSLFSMLFQMLNLSMSNSSGDSSPTSIPNATDVINPTQTEVIVTNAPISEPTDVNVEPTTTSPSNMPIPTITSSPPTPIIEQKGLCKAIGPPGLGDCSKTYYIKDGETQCRTCSTGFFGQQTGRATCTCPKNECVCEIGLTLGIQTVNCTPNGTLLVDPTIDSCF